MNRKTQSCPPVSVESTWVGGNTSSRGRVGYTTSGRTWRSNRNYRRTGGNTTSTSGCYTQYVSLVRTTLLVETLGLLSQINTRIR